MLSVFSTEEVITIFDKYAKQSSSTTRSSQASALQAVAVERKRGAADGAVVPSAPPTAISTTTKKAVVRKICAELSLKSGRTSTWPELSVRNIISVFAETIALSRRWLVSRSGWICDFKDSEDISIPNAVAWSLFWIALAIAFSSISRSTMAANLPTCFLAGYILEKSLSVDNLMVFVAIFASFWHQGCAAASNSISAFWERWCFACSSSPSAPACSGSAPGSNSYSRAIVAWTGWKMLAGVGEDEKSRTIPITGRCGLTQKLVPIFPRLHGHHFTVSHGHVQTVVQQDSSVTVAREAMVYATPMLLCLVCIEVSDIIFAFDSSGDRCDPRTAAGLFGGDFRHSRLCAR